MAIDVEQTVSSKIADTMEDRMEAITSTAIRTFVGHFQIKIVGMPRQVSNMSIIIGIDKITPINSGTKDGKNSTLKTMAVVPTIEAMVTFAISMKLSPSQKTL
jgi:hypothetical protein